MVAGKRAADLKLPDSAPGSHREVLSEYTTSFLQSTLAVSAAVTVTAYCLWAFGGEGVGSIRHDSFLDTTHGIPVIVGILHVLRLLDRGEGSAPEDLVLNDHTLQVLGILWIAWFAAGSYG